MEVVPPHLFLARGHPPSASGSNQGRYTYMSSGPSSQAAPHSTNHFSSYSQQSSVRSSSSTNATSASTLFNPPPPMPSSTPNPPSSTPAVTPFGANDSVLNKRGDKEASLFQICVNLRQRLAAFPGFEQALREEEEDADEDADPVTIVWRFFRRGYPLMEMYNALNPHVPLHVDPTKVGEKKRGQAATYKFTTACMTNLGISECFMVTDLYGDDTTGFVKVTRVVNQVLDFLVKEGVLGPDAASAAPGEEGAGTTKRTKRQHIIEELVSTERTYVQHLEMLQAFKKAVEERGVVSGDAIHDIFHNLNSLLDFQRRFLIRVEQTNLLPEDEQNWGSLFVLYKDAFKVYEPYIANQRKCEETAMREFDKLKETGGHTELRQFIENPTVLSAFLLKPFQRLSKYPLLLKVWRSQTPSKADHGRNCETRAT
jgi:cell division control protein 24